MRSNGRRGKQRRTVAPRQGDRGRGLVFFLPWAGQTHMRKQRYQSVHAHRSRGGTGLGLARGRWAVEQRSGQAKASIALMGVACQTLHKICAAMQLREVSLAGLGWRPLVPPQSARTSWPLTANCFPFSNFNLFRPFSRSLLHLRSAWPSQLHACPPADLLRPREDIVFRFAPRRVCGVPGNGHDE